MRIAFLLSFFLFYAVCLCAQPMQTRPLTELINTQDPGWPLVQGWIAAAKNKVQVLPKTGGRADSVLLAAQVTTRSPMGAVVYETGGILVDNGWLRILGSGSPSLNRDLMGWNKDKQKGLLLVADDVLGGFFALNGGAFGQATLGKIYYLAPDNLEWEPLDRGYSDFLVFCFSGHLEKFYDGLRWKGWQAEVAQLNGTQGISCVPFLFTKEGKDLNKVSRKPVPIMELWGLHNDFRQQLGIH
ncbi:DUF2625 domain-containing protein [Hymenobacter sp. DH14]|uniref:DUF2625 domain-containing protein n=1 Tax=Hymenobacter cyanobacteriorum TaxID=2926463 RepID=A0A9X2ADU9_9BACT|nr:DUF2625 domain-containing protein [Hymenobacter cyanobacteriorum]MCI1186561.1 DUF2625 domain-containing protein [Hymenobacter cyanobacteriorum]